MVSTAGTRLTFLVTLFIPATYLVFRILRRHQLSLSDPYNNSYTIWSTAFLLAFFGLVVCDLVLVLTFRRRVARSVAVFAYVVLGFSAIYALCFVVGVLRMIFP